jgi:hypothetical protein
MIIKINDIATSGQVTTNTASTAITLKMGATVKTAATANDLTVSYDDGTATLQTIVFTVAGSASEKVTSVDKLQNWWTNLQNQDLASNFLAKGAYVMNLASIYAGAGLVDTVDAVTLAATGPSALITVAC